MNPIGTEQAAHDADAEEQLGSALSEVSEALRHQQLHPDPEIGGNRPMLWTAVERFRSGVLPHVGKVLPGLGATEARKATEGIVAMAERLSAVLLAAGSAPSAQQLIDE